MNKKKLAGELIHEHNQKKHVIEDDVSEYRGVLEKEIINRIDACAHHAATKLDLYKNKDFYIVMLIAKDAMLKHPRYLIFARQSCPSPIYKQSVWKYHHQSGSLEFLWVIPDKILYYHILNNKHKYIDDAECQDILKFVTLMESGELLDWIKKENGEDTKIGNVVIKINKPEVSIYE